MLDKSIKAVQTGLLWIMKESASKRNLDKVKHAYSYVNKKDDSVFETFIELEDRIGVPGGDVEKIKSILGDIEIEDRRINPSFGTQKSSSLALRDYQEIAMRDIEDFLASGGTAFNLSGEPGSGKSFMLANLLVKLNTKVLIIAHLSSLTKQLQKEIQAVLGYTPQILTKGTKELKDINIATSQLISKNPDLWYKIKEGIGCLVVDEAESLGSLTTMRIFQRAHAKYHIFISATFSRSTDDRTPALLDFAGPKKVVLENPKLLKPNILFVHCPEVFVAPINKFQYAKAKQTFFLRSSIDDKVIQCIKSSLTKDRQVLVACDIIDMQDRLVSKLKTRGIEARAVNSNTSEKDRDMIQKEFNKGTIQVLLGFGTLNAGLSIPKISTIIRVSTPSSREKLEQLIGRGRRDFEGKDGCYVIDLVFKGFNVQSRYALYKKKVRQDGWNFYEFHWEKFKGLL